MSKIMLLGFERKSKSSTVSKQAHMESLTLILGQGYINSKTGI